MKRELLIVTALSLIFTGCSNSPSPKHNSTKSYSGNSSCGNASSCERLGINAINANNGNMAVKYLGRACNMGSASACNSAAFIYANAEGGVRQNYTKAMSYWQKACRYGDKSGCSNYQLAQDKLTELRRSR